MDKTYTYSVTNINITTNNTQNNLTRHVEDATYNIAVNAVGKFSF